MVYFNWVEYAIFIGLSYLHIDAHESMQMLHQTLMLWHVKLLTLKVLVTTIDAQWEVMGDVGSARYEPALLSPCPTIRVLSYSNK